MGEGGGELYMEKKFLCKLPIVYRHHCLLKTLSVSPSVVFENDKQFLL